MASFFRLRQIALVANRLAPVVDDLQAVFGLEVAYRDPGVAQFGLENAVMPIGHQFLEVVAPVQPGTAGGRYLERRGGDGGYMVICQTDDHDPAKARAAQLGIRSALEHDDRGYRIWQLHPGDTGGSFLEIDVQGGGEEMDGRWSPAGRNWQEAVRTEVLEGIAAAEIQSPEPVALAERWSAVVGLPVEVDAAGNPTLRLDNATIRFVADQDGRGEGLGGVDVVAVDAERALAEAGRRGLSVRDRVILVGGVRFSLVDA